MAQGKVYRNSNNLTTPPAIQGPEVSATWRRTCRGEVLMTVQMPQDTVDSEVYVKTPRGHSAVTMDPWTSSTWRKPWNKYHTPNKVTKDKLNRFAQQKTYKSISLNRTAGRQGQDRRSSWSPRPTRKYNPRALGLISGPCPSHFSRQVQLNKVRKEEDEECDPNPRKRAREATPFATGHIDDLKKMTKTVKPIYEGFWYTSNQDILARLDQAAKKLKKRRNAQLQDNQEDDNAMPATPNLVKSYSLGDEPIGHHVPECSKETLQDTLKEVIHSTPVEPLTGPPKIVHPFPEVSPQTLLPPPPGILANFSVKLNSITKMHTGPPPKAAQMLTALTTQPKVIIKRMLPEEIQSHTNSA